MPSKPTYHRSFADGRPSPGLRTETTQSFDKSASKVSTLLRPIKSAPVPALAAPPAAAPPPAPVLQSSPAGPAASPYVAGQALSGDSFVALHADGSAYYADSGTPADAWRTFGIATGGAQAGDTVLVQEAGEYTENSWNWTPGLPLFLGTAGQPTQAAPTSGFVLAVALALTATTVVIRIESAIVLAS